MKSITHEQRKALIDDIKMQHEKGSETLGISIRRLRLEVTGFDQKTFATMCNMSTKALYQIETDKGNPTLSTIDSILRKFGLRLGLASIIRDIPAPTLGAQKPVAKTPARGANPRRKSEVQPASPATARREQAPARQQDGEGA